MGNMRFKVGDRVRIKSLDWYNENKKKELRSCIECGNMMFTPQMSKWCGKIVTIIRIENNCYMDENTRYWTDEMIEKLVEEEIIDIDDFQDDNEIIDVIDEYVHRLKDNECQINLPEGYQFTDENGNVINATKIVLEKKEKEYPKTYEECLKVLGYDDRETYCIFHTGADERLFEALYRLKVCRDAYWKIAGREMGLGKPWEPDWDDEKQDKFIIHTIKDKIHCGISLVKNHLFAFPTEEMRDAFYENLKEEIEMCKELL